MIRILAVALSLGALPMAVAAQTPPPKSANATPIATTALGAIFYGAKSANPGERLFGQKCAFCHIGPSTGKFMLARRLPKDQAELPSRRDLTADYVKAVVRNGLVNMPTFTRVELSDPELAQIADWLARKGRK
jgi:cytochrome c5